jgi:hypothetical protein
MLFRPPVSVYVSHHRPSLGSICSYLIIPPSYMSIQVLLIKIVPAIKDRYRIQSNNNKHPIQQAEVEARTSGEDQPTASMIEEKNHIYHQ